MKEKLPINTAELKVLIVDEHDLIRKAIAKVLQALHIEEIVETHSTKEARKLIGNLHFDLVFTEIFFKSGDGYAIIDQIRHKDHRSDSPIIVLTGQAERDDIIKAIDKGATDYLLKPFQAPELEKKIYKVLTAFHSPKPSIKMLREAELLISENRNEDANKILNELARKLPTNPQPQYLKALVLLREEKYEAAVAALKEGIKNFPDFLKNYKLLSDIYLKQNDTESAIDALTQELEINPKHVVRQVRLANLLIKNGEYLRAIFHLRQALLENNKNAEALYGMGIAYAKDENIEKAIYYFKRYRRVFPQDSKPLEAIVQICRLLDQEKLAEIALRDEKKQHPERLDTYMILAKLFLQEERFEEAITTLQSAIVRHPLQKAPYFALAKLHLAQKDDAETINVFQQYRANTADPESYLYQAELFLNHNNFAQAIASVHSALATGYSSPNFLKVLITASHRTKQYAKNYFLVKKLMRMDKGSEPIQRSRLESVKELITQRRQHRKPKKDSLVS